METMTIENHPLSATAGAEAGRERRVVSGLDWRQAVGGALIGAGFVAIMIAWFGISGTLDPGKQMPYLASGGIGGAGLIAVGVTLLVSFEHARDRLALDDVLSRIEGLERRLDAAANGTVPATRSRTSRRTSET